MVLLARHVKPGLGNEGLGCIMGVEGSEIGGIGLKPQGLLILLILLRAGWLVTTGVIKLLVLEGGFARLLLKLITSVRLELLVIHLILVLGLIKLRLLVDSLFLLRLVKLLLLGPILLLALGLVAIVLLWGVS